MTWSQQIGLKENDWVPESVTDPGFLRQWAPTNYLAFLFSENCMKMKEIRAKGKEAASLAPAPPPKKIHQS